MSELLQSASGPHASKSPRLGRCDGVDDQGYKGPEVHHAVGRGANEDDPEREGRDVLLELDAAVHGDEDVVVPAHALEEFAVLDASPTTADDGIDVVAGKVGYKI
jgi:hypothetical protein